MNRQQLDRISGAVVDAGFEVHSLLGPGIFESAYEVSLEHELRLRDLRVSRQRVVPLVYKGVRIEAGYRIDLLVEDVVVVELKTVAKLLPIHEAQLLSYLKLGGYRLGLLMNFHEEHLRDGIKRMVNHY